MKISISLESHTGQADRYIEFIGLIGFVGVIEFIGLIGLYSFVYLDYG